jgi:polar amino acid transport system permease protein
MAPLRRKPEEIAEQEPLTIEVGDGAAIPRRKDVGMFTAWRVAFFGAIAMVLYLILFTPDPYRNIIAFVPDGIWVTFKVTVGAILLALVIGLFAGLGRLAENRVINGIASLYVEVIRGIPLLVQLFYIYYALGRIVNIPAITSAIIAMAVCYGAYMGEIFRAGIQSIPKGQMEAARSLGMNKSQAMVHVILPQAVTVILPPIGNEFVALLKDSSLVSILAVADLLRRGREFASETFTYFETYTMVALVYLIITLFFSKLVSIMEERISAGK